MDRNMARDYLKRHMAGDYLKRHLKQHEKLCGSIDFRIRLTAYVVAVIVIAVIIGIVVVNQLL